MIDKTKREWIAAENKAHDELVKNGFTPSCRTMDFKKVIVMKIENEHQHNEHREVFYFDNWQEAKASLCK